MNNKSMSRLAEQRRRRKEFILKIRKIAATAVMTSALGLGAIGMAGAVNADPKWPSPNPPWPGNGDVWLPGDPPGHNPFGPPGQVKKQPTINGVPNPFYGVPPGHWDDVPRERWNDPVYFGLPAVFLPPNIPGVTAPLPVVFNPGARAWGVFINPNWFIPLP